MMNRFLISLWAATALTSSAKAEGASLSNEAALTKRIKELEKNLTELKAQIKNNKVKTQKTKQREQKPTDTLAEATNPHPASPTPINSTISEDNGFKYQVGGRVKLDVMYDINARGALYGLDPSTMPLKNIDPAASNHAHLNAGISPSRLFAEAKKTFDGLPTSAYVEFDFAKDASSTTTSFSPRIRHLYAKVGGFLLGQTWYTFQDLDAFANVLDGLYGGSRQPMARYTAEFNKCTTLAIAAEKPNTQYIGNDGNLNDNNQYGKSQLPDFATQLKYVHADGHVTLSGVIRRLQVHVPKAVAGLDQNYTKTQVGWGLGFAGRYNFYKKSGIIWQINGGKGTGRYIDDLNSQDAYLQYGAGITPQFSAIKVINYIAGIEMWLTDKLVSNLAASITQISKPKTLLNVLTYNTNQQRYHVNIIYDILPNSKLGLEVMYYRRHAGLQSRNTGEDTRILTSFIYNF